MPLLKIGIPKEHEVQKNGIGPTKKWRNHFNRVCHLESSPHSSLKVWKVKKLS
jgi:hypothetical protein